MLRHCFLVTGVALSLASAAAAREFVVAAGDPCKIEFESKAAMETFTGKTNKVTGTIDLDPAQLGENIAVHVEVDMASLTTGSGLRDRHMRENHLNVDKFPTAVFTGGSISNLSAHELTAGQVVTGVIAGEMDLHGVKKTLSAPIEMSLSGETLHVVAHFPVALADFSIPRPQMLVMKLGETQKVTVDVVAQPKPVEHSSR